MTKTTKDWSREPRSELLSMVTAAVDTAKGEAFAAYGEDGHFVRLCDEALFPFLDAETEKVEATERANGGFPVGSWERPDPAGIVLRGEAAEFIRYYAERHNGEGPPCCVGERYDGPDRMMPRACERPAVMQVYGLSMCEAHGAEAAAGALEEIAYDLENELQRPMNAHVKRLSPHVEAALRRGFEVLPHEAGDYEIAEPALLEAFPLERGVVDAATRDYVEERARQIPSEYAPPSETYLDGRLLLCRHMRLAFEADADWLVETLERERELVSAQAAYALALEREAGLR